VHSGQCYGIEDQHCMRVMVGVAMFVTEDSSSLIPAANQTTTLGFSRLVDSEGEEGALLRSQYKLLDESQSAEESEKRTLTIHLYK